MGNVNVTMREGGAGPETASAGGTAGESTSERGAGRGWPVLSGETLTIPPKYPTVPHRTRRGGRKRAREPARRTVARALRDPIVG